MSVSNTAFHIDPVDPELIATGAYLKNNGLAAPDPLTTEIADVRVAQDRLGKFLADKVSPVATETTIQIPAASGMIPCQLYLPNTASPPPLLIYFHSGGFAYGSVAGWHGLIRDLVRKSNVAVLNVEYRLAPEHKFPAGLDDAIAAIAHAARVGGTWGVDSSRLAAGGDSAGANLALVSAMTLHGDESVRLKFLLLFYGVFSADTTTASWINLGTGAYGLSLAQMEWVWSTYLDTAESRNDWRAAPLLGDLTNVPNVLQIIGSLDPLIHDAHALKSRLDELGIANELKVYPGVNHGFVRFNSMIGQGKIAVDDAAAALHRELRSEDVESST